MRPFTQKKGVENITVNDEFIALTKAANRAMKLTSGQEAMKVRHQFLLR